MRTSAPAPGLCKLVAVDTGNRAGEVAFLYHTVTHYHELVEAFRGRGESDIYDTAAAHGLLHTVAAYIGEQERGVSVHSDDVLAVDIGDRRTFAVFNIYRRANQRLAILGPGNGAGDGDVLCGCAQGKHQ